MLTFEFVLFFVIMPHCVTVHTFRSFPSLKRPYNVVLGVSLSNHGSIDCANIKMQLQIDMKKAMIAKDVNRLAGIKSIIGAIKQTEIDEQIVVE